MIFKLSEFPPFETSKVTQLLVAPKTLKESAF